MPDFSNFGKSYVMWVRHQPSGWLTLDYFNERHARSLTHNFLAIFPPHNVRRRIPAGTAEECRDASHAHSLVRWLPDDFGRICNGTKEGEKNKLAPSRNMAINPALLAHSPDLTYVSGKWRDDNRWSSHLQKSFFSEKTRGLPSGRVVRRLSRVGSMTISMEIPPTPPFIPSNWHRCSPSIRWMPKP